MNYRGDDLDLRTRRGWATPAGEGAGSENDGAASGPIERYAPSRRPIWVDETVLACCNHAFDVAQAHRAGEVRLEHLLHAMTRVEAAAEMLEARGVRVFNLRRETGAIISDGTPPSPKEAASNPRRSDELEEILRRAAAQAYRHGVSAGGDPASVDDIVDVLSDARLDLPGLALFARHAARGAREVPSFKRMLPFAPEPPLHGRGDFPRERGRFSPAAYGHDNVSPAPRRGSYVEHFDMARGVEPHFSMQVLDRLEALEHALRELKVNAASQSSFADSAVAEIERVIETSAGEMASCWGHVTDALKAIEGHLDKGPGATALAPINDRLAIIEEALLGEDPGAGSEQARRFDALRQALDEHRSRVVATYSSIEAEIGALAGALREAGGLPASLEKHRAELSSTLAGLIAEAGARHDQRLAALENAVLGTVRLLEQRQKTVSVLIEQQSRVNGECLDHIDGRLVRMEQDSTRATELIETMHRLMVERYHWRDRFWRWLLGTNDWMAASWPAEASRVDAEMRAKGAR